MATDPRQRLGRTGEELALEHYRRRGFELVARNHRTRHGEIDLIVCDGTTLVFAEVKTRRSSSSRAAPWDSLHERKRLQVRRMARAYLASDVPRPRVARVRCDAVGVIVDATGRLVRLDQIEDAF
jgi:putative endonuclease